MLEASAVAVTRGSRVLLDRIRFTATAGTMVGLIGPNGAGKSTLMRILAGIEAPDQGTARLDGRDLGAIDPADRARRIAYLPQSGSIHGAVTVRETVSLGRLPHRGEPRARAAAAVDRALDRLDIADLADRRVTSLSGGERSRVLLARSLAVEAEWMIVDEPTIALDPFHQLLALERLAEETAVGRGVVIVLHDWIAAARFCDRLVLLDDGQVYEDGAPDQVLTSAALSSIYRVATDLVTVDGRILALPRSRLSDR